MTVGRHFEVAGSFLVDQAEYQFGELVATVRTIGAATGPQQRPMALAFDDGEGGAGNVCGEPAAPLFRNTGSESPKMTCAGFCHDARASKAAAWRRAFPASGCANGSIQGHRSGRPLRRGCRTGPEPRSVSFLAGGCAVPVKMPVVKSEGLRYYVPLAQGIGVAEAFVVQPGVEDDQAVEAGRASRSP